MQSSSTFEANVTLFCLSSSPLLYTTNVKIVFHSQLNTIVSEYYVFVFTATTIKVGPIIDHILHAGNTILQEYTTILKHHSRGVSM